MELVYFNGNNKSVEEVEAAGRLGVGALVVDSTREIELLRAMPKRRHVRCTLRVSPGIQPQTHSFISTGQLDSKFGFPIETGQALETLGRLLEVPVSYVTGVHAHIGSQIFDLTSYVAAVARVLDFLVQARDRLGFVAREMGMGGGFGIAYTREDDPPRPGDFARAIIEAVQEGCSRRDLQLPRLLLEPGRSIAGP